MSKNFNLIAAVTILVAGILVGGFLILSSKSGSADISQTISGLFGGNQKQDPKMLDSDKDGLTNWQEEIYKTNPNNPDTDNDGYLDGEEVMSGYDPLVPAPNDKISDKAIEPRPKPGSLSGFNLTDELSKSILENLKNSSPDASVSLGSGSQEDIANGLAPQAKTIVDNALSAALAKSPALNFVPTIPDSEIKVSNDDTLSAGQKFVDQISETTSQNIGFAKSEMEIAQEAVETKNYSLLDKYINGYKNLFLSAKEISAPPSWKEIHKKNLALIIATANILEITKLIDDDPLRAVTALQQYQQIVLPGLRQIGEDGLKLIKQQRGIE